MNRSFGKYYLVIVMVFSALTCRKPYQPAVLTKGDNYLVVDGFIDTSPGGITNILLSRTKNLTDTVVNIPERGAKVSIQNTAGTIYTLQEQGSNGSYLSTPLQLNNTGQYKILVSTAAGRQYASDWVLPKKTPAIDSVNWTQDSLGVHVFVNTHDPLNNTRYYRWQYVETWEYDSQLETPWGLNGNTIYVRDFNNLVHVCYTTTPSTKILLGTSAALAQDVISLARLFTIPANDTTLAHRMSIQVKQFALTPQAYSYWQIIQKNSEELGTLFDLQPSQLEGNIRCLDNSSEPVVGFMTAGTVEEKRIFISIFDLKDWKLPNGGYNCFIKETPTDPVDFSRWTYPDSTYLPWYFSGPVLRVAKNVCIDCRLSGGTTVKPSFW